jgi:DNA uptake protein ComE-like DNA-binding protein
VQGRAIDAEFVRAQLPTGDRPASPPPAAALGVQGGLFESWFRPARDPRIDRIPREGEIGLERAPEPGVRDRERVELEQPELEQPEFALPAFEPPAFEQPAFEQPELEQPELEQPEAAPAAPDLAAERVRINHADVDALRSLPHVGKALASRIVRLRRRKPFKSPADLRRVEGLSERAINEIADLISFD